MFRFNVSLPQINTETQSKHREHRGFSLWPLCFLCALCVRSPFHYSQLSKSLPSRPQHRLDLLLIGRVMRVAVACDLLPLVAEQVSEAMQLRLPFFTARAVSSPTSFNLAPRFYAGAHKPAHAAFKPTPPTLCLFIGSFMSDARAPFEIQILRQFVEHVARAGFERAHLWMSGQFFVSIGVKTGANHGAGLKREKHHARETLVNLHGMKEMYDRMLDVRFEHLLQVARGHAQHYVETIETPRDEMMRDETGRICAFVRLMIKRERDGAFAFKRVIDRHQIGHTERDERESACAFDERDHAH